MKVLYFDCSSGISGNMALGALLEIAGNEDYLIEELKKLNVEGYRIEISKKIKNGITGTYADVILEHDSMSHKHHYDHHSRQHYDHHSGQQHDHNHNHHHEHRNLYDVNKIIDESHIDEKSKVLAKRIFLRVAEAESKVHNKPLDEVHFHEVGAVDSIVDIVGTAILINKINPDKIISSVVNDGYGFIECAHGTMSVPVPATSEIFAASNAKVRQIDIDTELVTPTGAAIIAELAEEFRTLPVMVTEKIGWGAGSKDLKIPNLLKVYYGETEELENHVLVIDTCIDDCNGEILGYVSDKLLTNGALDVFYTPVYMKKGRPAYCLTVVCRKEDSDSLKKIIFRETTSIGVRYRYESRTELKREITEVNTEYGKIKVKKVISNGETYIYPEYESIRQIAIEKGIPLKELYKLKEFN